MEQRPEDRSQVGPIMPSTGPGVRADTRTELYHAIPDDRTAALPGSAPSPYPPPPPAYAPPPGYYPQPIYVTQQVQMAPAYVAVAAPKSMAAALLLTFFFGPLGLFYASVAGGIVMLIVSVLLAMVTFGLSLFVTVPACMVWAAIATSNYNARLAGPPQYSQNVR